MFYRNGQQKRTETIFVVGYHTQLKRAEKILTGLKLR